MSLAEYYKRFISFLGVLAAMLAALPLISKLLPESLGKYAFPPLGDSEPLARIGTVCLAVLTTYVVYFLGCSKPAVKVLVPSVLAAVAFAFYMALSSMFVRKVDIPAENTTVLVSVGHERTDFAKRNFGNKSDWEMLLHRGLNEEAIRELWTPNSVLEARMALWLSFSGSLIFVIAALGFGILNQEHHQKNPTP